MQLPEALEYERALEEYKQFSGLPLISAAERIGLRQGLLEGYQEGRSEGIREGICDAITRLLTLTFVSEAQPAIQDLEAVEEARISAEIVDLVASIGECRGVPIRS